MAAIYHNQYNNNFSSGGSTSISFSYTCSSKDNKVLLIILRIHAGSISALSYAGAPLTLLATNGSMSLYGLLAPKAGSNTVNMGCATSSIVLISAADFSGVDQINTYTPTVSATGSGTAFSTPKLSLVTGGVGYGGFYTNYTNATGSFTGSGNTTLLSATRDAGSGKRNGHGINFEPNSLNWSFSGAGVAWWSIGVGLTPHEEMSGKYKPPRVYRQYTSQPQQLTGIENLAAEAAIWTATAPTTAIVRRASVNGNPVNPIYGISEAGKSVYWTDGSSSTNGINFSRLFNTNTSEFTILILAQPVAEAVIRIPFAQKESGSIFIPNMTLLFNASGGSPESGSISIYARDNNAFGRNLRATNQIDGELHCWVLSMSSTTGGSIFRDGVSQTLATNDNLTGGSLWGTNAVSNIGSSYGGDFTSRFPYPLHLVAVWPRKLSMAAQAYLSANPNTIFAPLKVYPFISSEAAQSPISNKPLIKPATKELNRARQINWANPITRGLLGYSSNGISVNVVNNFSILDTSVRDITGIGTYYTGSAGIPSGNTLDYSTLTLVADVKIDADPNTPLALNIGYYISGVDTFGFGLGWNDANNTLAPFARANTNFYNGNNSGITITFPYRKHVMVTVSNWGSLKLYENGNPNAAYTTTAAGSYINSDKKQLSISGSSTMKARYSYLFNRILSNEEDLAIRNNPDILFIPQEKFIQTAYAPKAPWSVARSRVLGTSTGAPATVATTGTFKKPVVTQPLLESSIPNIVVAWNPAVNKITAATSGLFNNYISYKFNGTSEVAVVSNKYRFTLDYSVLVVVRVNSYPASQANIATFLSDTSSNPGVSAGITISPTGVPSVTTRSTGSAARNGTATRAILIGETVVLLASIRESNKTIWINGRNSGAHTTASNTQFYGNLVLGGPTAYTAIPGYVGVDIGLIAVLPYPVVTDDHARRLSDNPWQIFAANNSNIWTPT